ncbi:MAG: cytochrome c biogenesis protein ResB, partial [Candidatus Dormibacteraeota bacterium]|nr:cytochrome c biogenesis protein ResB [Candidatus Dormibacteraeota bacterium]
VRWAAYRGWLELRRARTAIGLLVVLAVLSIIGTLLPQLPQNPRGVFGYVLTHPTTGPLFARLGLYDVFSSWFFLVTALLMYISLTAFLWVRVPAAWRRWRQGIRTAGLWADLSSIAFHASFYLLLVGVVYGKAFGFVGAAAIVEGGSFVEARANYDNLDEGDFAPAHQGYQLTLDSFRAQYWSTGKPADFLSRVRIFDGGRMVESQNIRVNHYLDYRGDKIYQIGYGWAPWVRVRMPDGRLVADAPVMFLGDQAISNGVIKAPSAGRPGQQLAATALLIPDPRVSGQAISAGTAERRNPILLLQLWRGDLHLDTGRPQNVYALDTNGMSLVWRGLLRIGDSVTTADGVQIAFPALRQYSDLKVTHDPGVGIVYGAFILAMATLFPMLYLPLLGRHRRLGGRPTADRPCALTL